MTDAVRYPLVLGIICLISAAGLAITYSATRDPIRFQERLEKDRALADVFGIQVKDLSDPQAPRPWHAVSYPGTGGEGGGYTVYEAEDIATGKLLFASEGRMQGYSSKVQVIVAVDQAIEKGLSSATIRAVKVVSQLETPGLGSHSMDPDFQRQFDNLPAPLLKINKSLPAYRNPESPESRHEEIAAITGATITTTAVVGAVLQALENIRHHVEAKKGAGA